jgi:hypothetical protein
MSRKSNLMLKRMIFGPKALCSKSRICKDAPIIFTLKMMRLNGRSKSKEMINQMELVDGLTLSSPIGSIYLK